MLQAQPLRKLSKRTRRQQGLLTVLKTYDYNNPDFVPLRIFGGQCFSRQRVPVSAISQSLI